MDASGRPPLTPREPRSDGAHKALSSPATVEEFIPQLVYLLRAEQPADPVAFLRAHLDAVAGTTAPAGRERHSSAPAPAPASTGEPIDAEEVAMLRAEVDTLRRENARLRAARTPAPARRPEWRRSVSLGCLHAPRQTTLTCCNWNLAGVNENPFEFGAPRCERFPRVASFIHAVDLLLAQILFTHDQDLEESEEAQIRAAVTEPLAVQVRGMTLPDLLRGLLAVADTARADGHRSTCDAQNDKEVLGQPRVKCPEDTDDGVEEDHRAPLVSRSLSEPEAALAISLADMIDASPPSLLELLRRGLSSAYFSKPDLKLKARRWCLTSSRPRSVRKFLAGCRGCFAAEAGGTAEEEIWWRHWLASVCSSVVEDRPSTLAALAFPIAVFDVLLAKLAGHVVADKSKDEEEAETLLCEMKDYVLAMRTTTGAKAEAIAAGFDWTMASYDPSAITLQEFNAAWLEEPRFKRLWAERVDGEQVKCGGYEVIKPATVTNEQQQVILLIKKRGALRVDQLQTMELVSHVAQRAALEERLRVVFRLMYPQQIVEEQVQAALEALMRKVAMAVCSLRCEDNGSLGATPAMELVLVVGAHASSDGTDNRAIVAAAKELTLWLGSRPGAMATPRLLMMMDANSAASFPTKGVMSGAATQHVFSTFVHNDSELSSCWLQRAAAARPRQPSNALARTLSATPTVAIDHSVMKERTYIQTQWKKSGVLDMSLKDWVVLSADGTRSEGVAINRFGTPEFEVLSKPLWANGRDDTSAVWSADSFMPGPQFPSDHAMVIANVSFTERVPSQNLGLDWANESPTSSPRAKVTFSMAAETAKGEPVAFSLAAEGATGEPEPRARPRARPRAKTGV